MRKICFAILLGLILGNYASADKTIPSVDLKNWDGENEVNGWKNVTRRKPPKNQEWKFLKGYALAEATHPRFPPSNGFSNER